MLPFSRLIRDERAQSRVGLSEETVNDYADLYRRGVALPAVVAFTDGAHYWLADGWHRCAALDLIGRRHVECTVRGGGLRDAILFAVGCNSHHGLRPGAADARHRVLILLKDPEWSQWSNREVARRCAVSEGMVRYLRRERAENEAAAAAAAARLARRGGQVYPHRLPARPAPAQTAAELNRLERAARLITCPHCGGEIDPGN
jgi:ParB-like chromosome segregation protein Spo0J